MRALIRLEGQPWQEEDWTQTMSTVYCRDRNSERPEELVIIASNSEWQDRNDSFFANDFHLYVSHIGCWRWAGTATTTTHIQSDQLKQSVALRG